MGKTIQEWKTEVEKTTGRALSKNENEYFEVLTELLDMLDWKDALHAKDIALLDSKLLFVEKDPKAPLPTNSGSSNQKTSIRSGNTSHYF